MSDLGIVVTGACGRMGMRVARLALEASDVRLVGACDLATSQAVGRDAGEVIGAEKLGVLVRGSLGEALASVGSSGEGGVTGDISDVAVVDFTNPAGSLEHAVVCARGGVPLVVGSTGFDSSQRQRLEEHARSCPLLFAPNMSLGMNVMFHVVKKVAEALGDDFDVEILEAHHRMKADAPSGSALRLGEVVAEALGRELGEAGVYHREGMTGARSREEIGLQTLRGGDVAGEHTVYFFGDGERLEITHRATTRDIFASGAIKAARWLRGKSAGLYGMEDVLRIE